MGSDWIKELGNHWDTYDKEEARAHDAEEKRSERLREDAGLNWERILRLVRADVDAFSAFLRSRGQSENELSVREESNRRLVVSIGVSRGSVSVGLHLPDHGRFLVVESHIAKVFEEGTDNQFHVRLKEAANQGLLFWDEDEEQWDTWDRVSKKVFSVFVEAMKLTPKEL